MRTLRPQHLLGAEYPRHNTAVTSRCSRPNWKVRVWVLLLAAAVFFCSDEDKGCLLFVMKSETLSQDLQFVTRTLFVYGSFQA
jgi:hypothetical protein